MLELSKHVSKSYRSIPAVKDVSFVLKAGRGAGVPGPEWVREVDDGEDGDRDDSSRQRARFSFGPKYP